MPLYTVNDFIVMPSFLPVAGTTIDVSGATVQDGLTLWTINTGPGGTPMLQTGSTEVNNYWAYQLGSMSVTYSDCSGHTFGPDTVHYITTTLGMTYLLPPDSWGDAEINHIDVLTVTPHGGAYPGPVLDGDFDDNDDVTTCICFAAGTHILTINGEVQVQDLKVGDKIHTMDNGYRQIRWIGETVVPASGNLAPIVFKVGAIGNTRELRVSPQHRMLVSGWHAETLFGEHEVLCAAKYFVNDETVFVREGGEVEYFHIMFDDHEIVFAEGAPAESFHPGTQGAKTVDSNQYEELMVLFPKLREDITSYSPAARMSLRAYEGPLIRTAPHLFHQ